MFSKAADKRVDESDVFEIEDFTAATPLEKLIAAIEECFWDWGVGVARNLSSGRITKDPAAVANKVRGMSAADVMQSASKTIPLNPNTTGDSNVATGLQQGMAKGQVMGQMSAKNKQIQGMNAAVDMGRGENISTLDTQQALATSSAEAATAVQNAQFRNRVNEQNATLNLIGQGVGTIGAISQEMLRPGNTTPIFQSPLAQAPIFNPAPALSISTESPVKSKGFTPANERDNIAVA